MIQELVHFLSAPRIVRQYQYAASPISWKDRRSPWNTAQTFLDVPGMSRRSQLRKLGYALDKAQDGYYRVAFTMQEGPNQEYLISLGRQLAKDYLRIARRLKNPFMKAFDVALDRVAQLLPATTVDVLPSAETPIRKVPPIGPDSSTPLDIQEALRRLSQPPDADYHRDLATRLQARADEEDNVRMGNGNPLRVLADRHLLQARSLQPPLQAVVVS